jgi:molybdopterin converting factor small subunit
LRIRLYGRLADAIAPEIELAAAGCSVGEIRKRLAVDHMAAARSLEASRALIADRVVGDEQTVCEGDELEFLPPVSGG